MSLAAFMGFTGTITRPTSSQQSIGTNAPTFTTIYSNVPFCIEPAASSINMIFDRPDLVGTHILTTNMAIALKANDRIQIGSDYYIVSGFNQFQVPFSGEVVYQVDATKRTV